MKTTSSQITLKAPAPGQVSSIVDPLRLSKLRCDFTGECELMLPATGEGLEDTKALSLMGFTSHIKTGCLYGIPPRQQTPQTPNHTTPPPSSQAAAYGYKHAGSMASQGMAWGHTLTESGNMAYGGSVSVSWYSGSSESGYSFPIAAAIGIGARYLDRVPKAFGMIVWLSVDPLADKRPCSNPL